MPMSTRHYRRKRRNGNRFFFTALVIIGAIIFWQYQQSFASPVDQFGQNGIPSTPSVDGVVWADANYPYRKPINISSSSPALVEFKFDHQSLVYNNQSLADGTDMRIIAQLNNASDNVYFEVNDLNTASTRIRFDTKNYPTASYFLYFGNRNNTTNSILGITTLISSVGEVTVGSTQTPTLSISSDKVWALSYKEGTQINLNFTLPENLRTTKNKLYLVNANNNSIEDIDWSSSSEPLQITSKKIATGKQSVYIALKTPEGEVLRSNNVTLQVSKPMFVAWTIDWEGNDIQDWVLRSLESIMNQYKMPLTHFFNPRIYITQIPQYRRDQLTNWVKARQISNGDEIAMHMHMHYDMIRAAGVEVKTSPRWGSGIDGYDVLTSDYTYSEITKIIQWGLQQFELNGLSKPAGYRAGGWFASLDTLKALNNLNFTYDSSGRETYQFGAKKVSGLWSLTPSSQPYQPSSSDQNSSSPEPRLDLWEMPNNGNDSYWFNTQQLIDRFYINYPAGQILNEPRMLTYLSHLDWFEVDQPRVQAVMAEIDKYSFENDAGPVVYVTLSEALKEWDD